VIIAVIDPKTLQSMQATNDACASNQVFSNHLRLFYPIKRTEKGRHCGPLASRLTPETGPIEPIFVLRLRQESWAAKMQS
jgi:hypothetical protein